MNASPIPGHALPNGLNGDHTPELTANGVVNGSALVPASPPVESPVTPISTAAAPDVKIDIDYQEQESDARHEPMPIKSIEPINKSEDSQPPTDIHSSAIDASTGSPHRPPDEVNDIHMDDAPANGVNGTNGDVDMHDGDLPTPTATPGLSVDMSMASIESNGAASSPNITSPADEGEDRPHPAKRLRVHSDADKASFTHSATPPPASTVVSNDSTPVPPESSGPATINTAQFRFCQSTIRSLKKLKDAAPFVKPVDPVALNIPHYPSIIKHPMDFSTIERKLNSSNPAKPDPNPQNPRYANTDGFISDVRLIFHNCLTFNGPDHAVALMGKRVEEVFDKQIKQMPAAAEPKAPVVKKVATPPPPPPPPVVAPVKKAQPPRRASTSVPVIRRSDTETIGRPKREIHPPPPKDLPYADAPKKHRKGKREKSDGAAEQLKYCLMLLQLMNRKQYYGIASPFYEPVDWVRLELPNYPKIVKKPMDLSTMRKKLENNEYANAQKFCDDFKLMIRNCFTFNPAGTPVNQAGIELQRLFDEKWKALPPIITYEEDDDEDEVEDDTDEERQPFAGTIAMMESQIETMRGSLAALKGAKQPKEKKKKEKREKAPVASTSKVASKPTKAPKKKGKKPVADDDVLSFEQKKDLSESIGKLDGAKLEKVIQIIHEGVPEIRDSTEEIELEIDLLPPMVLTKLYNFVLRPLRTPATKRSRPGKGTGTGGLKRKSMDEDVEAEKIRLLEQRMALFDQGAGGAPAPARLDDNEHSSDSSSGSDSSGSDSE